MKTLVVSLTMLLGGAAFSEEEAAPWWAAFENATLSEWIEQGLASHPDPAVALAEVAAARAREAKARTGSAPAADLNLSVRGGKEKTMYSGREVGTIDPVAGSVQLSWEIDLFGRVKHATRAAEARGERSLAELRGVRLVLAGEIARQVFEAALLREWVAIRQETMTVAIRLENRLAARVGAGVAQKADLDRARARRHMTEHALAEATSALAQRLNALGSLVGKPVAAADVPGLPALKVPGVPEFDAGQQMRGRPDVMAAWWAVQGAAAAADSARGARAPTLALVASAAGEASRDGAEPWRAWVGPTVQLPLWRPDLKADARRSRAEAERAKATFESVALTALREIEDTRIHRVNAEEMMTHSVERSELLDRATASEKRKREAGLTQADAWLQAQWDALAARQDALTWRKNALNAQLALIKALGGT